MIRVGLCGAQGTGKTTLASALATQLGIPFIKTDVAQIIRDAGYHSCREGMSTHERLDLQEVILNGLVASYPKSSAFICDRTPFDVMMYSLGWLPPFASSHESDRVMELMTQCAAETDRHFSLITQIHPGIVLSASDLERDDRGSLHAACVAREDAILTGLLCNYAPLLRRCAISMMPAHMTSLDKRLQIMLANAAALPENPEATVH